MNISASCDESIEDIGADSLRHPSLSPFIYLATPVVCQNAVRSENIGIATIKSDNFRIWIGSAWIK